MKVLNLRCSLDHGFEGWFASEDDFLAQQARAIGETTLIEIGILAGETALEFSRRGACAWQHERTEANFHGMTPSC